MKPTEIVQHISKTLENAWNNANGSDFGQPFTDIIDFVDIRGTLHHHVTAQYIGDAHQALFMSIYKGSKVNYNLVDATLIDQHTILANIKTELETPVGPFAGKSSSTITMILILVDEHWKIRAFHNTLVVKG